jgi:hypothetical protein
MIFEETERVTRNVPLHKGDVPIFRKLPSTEVVLILCEPQTPKDQQNAAQNEVAAHPNTEAVPDQGAFAVRA